MTPYALLIQICGLSHREAADFHAVRLDTVKSWSAGRNRPPNGVIRQLRDLHAAINRAADEAVTLLVAIPDGVTIEIGYPVDDHEARHLGFPCIGAWRAMAGVAVSRLDRPVSLVPRGSTPATAKAAGVRELTI